MGDNPTTDPETNVNSESDKVAAAIYDHLRATRDRDDEAHPIYLNKARFLMGIVLVVFASMSFALSRMGWAVAQEFPINLVLLLIIGGLAALVLFAAFWCGIQCHRIRQVPVVGVRGLKDVLKSDDWKRLSPEKTHRDLSINLAEAILATREADAKRGHWATWLHNATLAGSLLAAIFIVYALLGDVLSTRTETIHVEHQREAIQSGTAQ